MVPGQGIDELDGDPNSLPLLLDAAFDHIPHPHLFSDLLNLYRFALVCEGRVPGDHKNAFGFGEAVDDSLGKPVA